MIGFEGNRKSLIIPLVGSEFRFLIRGGVVHGLVFRCWDFVPVGFWYVFLLERGMTSRPLVHCFSGQKFEAIIKLN